VAYVTLSTFAPLVVVRRVGVADAAAVSTMLQWVDAQVLGADRPRALVYDAGTRPDGQPDAQARRVGGEWFKRRRSHFVRHCLGFDFAFPSALSRGALTAVFWIARPSVPYDLHASSTLAIEKALARAGLTGKIAPSSVTAALDELAARWSADP
jgi:hypothetical protein